MRPSETYCTRCRLQEVSVSEAMARLGSYTYIDLGFARVDHNREQRTGVPEVVYCDGKTPEQAAEIVRAMYEGSASPVLATHASEAHARLINEAVP